MDLDRPSQHHALVNDTLAAPHGQNPIMQLETIPMPTQRANITRTAFTNLGPGPMYLQNRGPGPVYFLVDTTDPIVPNGTDINDLPQHSLGDDGQQRDISINFTQNVYVRGVGAVFYTK